MNAITKTEAMRLEAPLVEFQLNGRDVQGRASETLIEIAKREGIEIPHLCYKAGMEAVDKAMLTQYPNMAITPAELLKYEQLRDLGEGMKAFSKTVSEIMASK